MAGPGIQQLQKQSQIQVLAPQLRQSLKILQAPALELRSTILEELETNPVLEELPREDLSLETAERADGNDDIKTRGNNDEEGPIELEVGQDLSRIEELEASWDYEQSLSKQLQGPYTSEDSERRQHLFDSYVSEASLQEHLMEQVRLMDLADAEKSAMPFLIGSLDDSGFLSHPLKDLEELSGQPLAVLERALKALQSMDPPGIAAKDLQDSLLIQLELRGLGDTLAARIIREHYRLFLRRRVPELARCLGVHAEAIHEALEVVASLDPAPGRKFREDTNREVVADVEVEPVDGEWRVSLVSVYIPRLRLSPVYKNMLTDTRLSDSEHEYIRDKIRSGKLIIDAIEQRQNTLERIAKAIVSAQIDFLETGTRALKPLTLNQVAEVVGLHETTVSRAIANKYMQTPHGLFEFKYFFRGGFTSDDGKEVSSTSVKDIIKNLIEDEDLRSPLSDQALCEILAEKNLQVARRTVAKYREELGIAPTHLRRQYS